MIRLIIAEDDPQCYAQLEQFLNDYSRETGQAFRITHYDNGEDLVEHYKPEYDLLLLDVDMPFIDGMTAAGHIRKVDPEVVIVFVTSLAQYAIQGYLVNLAHVSGIQDGCVVCLHCVYPEMPLPCQHIPPLGDPGLRPAGPVPVPAADG